MDKVEKFTIADRKILARIIVGVLKSWGLSGREKAWVLGLSPKNRSTITRYSNGHPVAQRHDLFWRIGNILAIHGLLHSHRINRPKWITTPNSAIDGARPIDLMKKPDGVAAIRALLEDARMAKLEHAGLAKRGKGPFPKDFWSKNQRPVDTDGACLAALLEEREEGR